MVPGIAFQKQATDEQIETMRKMIHAGIDDGGMGIGFLLDYMSPAIREEELRMIFSVAKERNVVVWTHIRRGINGDIQPLKDLIRIAAEIGSALHICHINANAMGEIQKWMEVIDEANRKGADISAEIFPYTAGSTSISADVFNRDWQKIFGITYKDVQWAETGEYFTAESWEEKRRTRPDGIIIHHYMKEDWLKIALKHPNMIIATDAMPAMNEEKKAAPNGASSYTRLLAKYVRDEKVLTIEEAFSKGSYYPARRLEKSAPRFANKGRIQKGADADLLIFDIANIKVNASYLEPFKKSSGWDYVIVGGKVVFEHGTDTGARPGQYVDSRK
jgi:N-acyl-D-aspartate/D-glutamate deacylase